jgi:hypothetical protein
MSGQQGEEGRQHGYRDAHACAIYFPAASLTPAQHPGDDSSSFLGTLLLIRTI